MSSVARHGIGEPSPASPLRPLAKNLGIQERQPKPTYKKYPNTYLPFESDTGSDTSPAP